MAPPGWIHVTKLKQDKELMKLYGAGGVCKGYVIFWMEHCAKTFSSENTFEVLSENTNSSFVSGVKNGDYDNEWSRIGLIMQEQKEMLQQIEYKYKNEKGPISNINTEEGRWNQNQAIEVRAQWIRYWAQTKLSNLCFQLNVNDWTTSGWISQMYQAAKNRSFALGYISMQGSGGHALGCIYIPNAKYEILFFDPNHGEYLCSAKNFLEGYSTYLIKKNYQFEFGFAHIVG